MDRRECYDKLRQAIKDGRLLIHHDETEELRPYFLTDSQLALAYALDAMKEQDV